MLRIRTMSEIDSALAMSLKDQAGWNQTEVDWRRFLDMEPAGCFVAEWDGRPVGTTVTCILGRVAWIAMVLVEPHFRGRGIGKALMSHALDFLESQGVPSVRLDATELGKPLYEKLGFQVEYGLARFEGVPQDVTQPPGKVDKANLQDWPGLFQLDQKVTGADRSKFLGLLFAALPETIRVVRSEGSIIGYLAARPGTRAWQIGPCLGGRGAGAILLADAGSRFGGKRVFVDIPVQNEGGVALAKRNGLTVQRHLIRMRRGQPMAEHTDHIWASSGPELG